MGIPGVALSRWSKTAVVRLESLVLLEMGDRKSVVLCGSISLQPASLVYAHTGHTRSLLLLSMELDWENEASQSLYQVVGHYTCVVRVTHVTSLIMS